MGVTKRQPSIPKNALLPWKTDVGEFMYTSFMPMHPLKACSPIDCIPLGIVKYSEKESQFAKALSPIEMTDSGIKRSVFMSLSLSNEPYPIEISPSGKSKLSTPKL